MQFAFIISAIYLIYVEERFPCIYPILFFFHCFKIIAFFNCRVFCWLFNDFFSNKNALYINYLIKVNWRHGRVCNNSMYLFNYITAHHITSQHSTAQRRTAKHAEQQPTAKGKITEGIHKLINHPFYKTPMSFLISRICIISFITTSIYIH